jgi:hypothetical protein
MFGQVLSVRRTPEELENFRKAGYDEAPEGATKLLRGTSSGVTERMGGPSSGVGPTRSAETDGEPHIRYRVESEEAAEAEPSKVAERVERVASAASEKENASVGAASERTGSVLDAATAGAVGAGGVATDRVRFSARPGDADTAVLVCHGMGEQVRYETISSVAEALKVQARNAGGRGVAVETVLSRDKDDFLAHAQVSWTDKANQPRKVDVYEAYWAPVTEGQVSYYDTILFLLQAAWSGLRHSKFFRVTHFKRWMFNGRKTMKIGRATKVGLVAVLCFLLLLMGNIAYVTLALANNYKHVSSIPVPSLTGVGFTGVIARASLKVWHLFRAIPWYQAGSWLCWINWRKTADVVLWMLFVLLAFAARYFIIEYVGDVAAYVSPYKDSKFDEIRHKIQQIGLNVGKTIYGFGTATPNVPYYKRVVIVGHSLGSVLAYDTLNALLNLDNVLAQEDRRGVVERTRALITMGSPLDKTAFIFRMQAGSSQDWIREAMAASVQPLIVSYRDYRKKTFDWVNIWAPNDIISGELNYYDDPGLGLDMRLAPCVQNHKDEQAWPPIVSHVQYFEHQEFHEWLYRFVT